MHRSGVGPLIGSSGNETMTALIVVVVNGADEAADVRGNNDRGVWFGERVDGHAQVHRTAKGRRRRRRLLSATIPYDGSEQCGIPRGGDLIARSIRARKRIHIRMAN
ncbi:hypothetical protein GUJ93_ZPchr0007g5644 [Zizania palustris]|uniref:Uncharacterized protein n=1 Tax=Zizania palustris TaxID=103762 RepID=A0A8J5T3U3_ZIZPA|nr:hypothetical protein GUJ93_ZPchr0007g5644 [Zizania palustris]